MAALGNLSAGMVHELRNPLNSVLNGAKVLQERGDNETIRERLLPLVVDGAQRMESIISALGSHTRAGDSHAAFDLNASILASLRLLTFRARDVKIETELPERCVAYGEEGPIAQVLVNLLDNALRSGAQHVWVRATTGDEIAVEVADDGEGIDEHHSARIFEPFFTTRNQGGTGLGLFISKSIVEEQGGTIEYRNRSEGQGTVFRITLPAAGEDECLA
jgi:two-component system sensor histidine kinase PhcS